MYERTKSLLNNQFETMSNFNMDTKKPIRIVVLGDCGVGKTGKSHFFIILQLYFSKLLKSIALFMKSACNVFFQLCDSFCLSFRKSNENV